MKRISPATPGCLSWTCPCLLVRIASIPPSVAFADESDLKPRMGVIRFLSAAWSLSMRLFSHFRLMYGMPSPGSSNLFISPITRA